MGTQWAQSRASRLAPLVAARGLSTTGFRQSLRALLDEFLDEEDRGFEEDLFEDWFLNVDMFLPAAFRLKRDGREGICGVTVEVYEVENTNQVSMDRLEVYGMLADGNGPCFELHILDRFDNEIVILQSHLECLCNITREAAVYQRELLGKLRSLAVAQHHAPVVIEHFDSEKSEREIKSLRRKVARAKDRRSDWKAAYDAVRELGVEVPKTRRAK